MSWESIVDGAASTPSALDDHSTGEHAAPAPTATSPLTGPAPIDAPIGASTAAPMVSAADDLSAQPSPAVDSDPLGDISFAPISFAPLTLDPLTPAQTAPSSGSTAATPPAEPASTVFAAGSSAMPPAPPIRPQPPMVRVAPVDPIVPALVDEVGIEPVAADVQASFPVSTGNSTVETPAVPSSELPVIVEATPVDVAASFGVSGLVSDPVGAGPQLPQVQQQPVRPQAVAFQEFSTPAVAPISTTTRRRKSRRGLKLVLTLVVLGGLVAAGVVFGRPYLTPSEWDATTEPYADAVEAARGVEYAEPIMVSAEPTADHTLRLVGELAPDWSSDEPMWRALGLLNGAASQANVAELFVGWQDALYSTADGQVYQDAASTGPQADAAITTSMAAASLDQQYRWSADQVTRTTDDQVLTLAEVLRQARAVVSASPFAAPADPSDPAVLAYVPPLVGYRALAPTSFAEFGTASADPENALSSIGTAGPGPLATEPLVLAPDPTMAGSDVRVSSPRSLDRSFWYLVLAGYLDSRTAHQASEAIVENAVSMADRAGTACVYATFAGGDVDGTATLRSALETWASAAPAEFGANLTVLDDGTLQLVSCDPGAGFENASRLGVARELVVWRTAELATIDAISGTELDLATTWAFVEASNVAPDLIALPADTSPADMAVAARAGVAAVLAPAG